MMKKKYYNNINMIRVGKALNDIIEYTYDPDIKKHPLSEVYINKNIIKFSKLLEKLPDILISFQ